MLIPNSTYRVQLHAGFNFSQLECILDYLHQLGISTIYASPITKAITGSQHGYDAIDPLSINPEIGTEQDLERLSGLLKKYGMSWLQDIVPNHMAFTSSNPWLYDALERGKDSEYYSFFDIDTDTGGELTGEKVMAPFLGKTLTECLQGGELSLDLVDQGFVIRYFENIYPVAITLYRWIVTVAEGCPTGLLAILVELEDAAKLPANEWKAARQKRLKRLSANEEYNAFLRQRVHFFNQQSSLIGELVQGQHYILTYAHLAASRINYRRFFTVNSLICLRMEEEKVFTAYHEQIHAWYRKGYIQGLRLDHIDGLAAPRSYIRRLREKFGAACYIVAEKILEEGESLPDNWELEGMTGYEFLSPASQVLTDSDGSRKLLPFYNEQVIGIPVPNLYEDMVFEKKHHFLITYMGGELDNLLRLLYSLPLLGAAGQDKKRLKEALAVLMSSFPVYRIYPDEISFPPASRTILSKAFAHAREKGPGTGRELDFLESIFREGGTDQHLRFQTRLMQFTGPLAAKGIEDTTFYVYNPFIAHNEVGDTPSIAGITSQTFHEKMTDRRARLPYSLNATSTHDTKRGEDSRIRLNWLSSVADEWISSVNRWREMNRFLITGNHAGSGPIPGGTSSPVPNDEYLIYQALLGGFPEDGVVTDLFRERFHNYLTKALREGKTTTSWDHPDEEYEQKCHAFVTTILQPESDFLEDFIPFAGRSIRQSLPYTLSQLLIKLTVPGIPDIYQGAELWETSFVDPDNRRPVDYALRAGLLRKIKEEEAIGHGAVLNFVLANRMKGAAKLFTIYRTLNYRNNHPSVFSAGDYIPLSVKGQILAYLRRYEKSWVLVVTPLMSGEAPQQGSINLQLPDAAPVLWTNIFTGDVFSQADGVLELKELWSRFPIALLTGQVS
jgi:(1->4)-alpha-D-glucan 1-alpha-D-glucosylmutase